VTELVLYSTAGCHLCEEAVALLEKAARSGVCMSWLVRDIAGDDRLIEKYGTRIPVLSMEATDDDLGWPFKLDDVMAFIGATEAAPHHSRT
jgi:hypothetical protein